MKTSTRTLAYVLVGLVLCGCMAIPGLTRTEFVNDIYYMCAAWGPDLEAKKPEKADEVIYFIKQILFKRKAGESVEPLGGRLSFCTMNWEFLVGREHVMGARIGELHGERLISIQSLDEGRGGLGDSGFDAVLEWDI